MSANAWFGSPQQVDLDPEEPAGRATDQELDHFFARYAALDRVSSGKYTEFLQTAARCSRCSKDRRIPATQQPIPLLCGTATDRDRAERAHEALDDYRRDDRSLRFDPDDGVEPLAAFLDAHQLTGLSVGHCGWGDLTARLRGAQLGEGVDVMVLGADWYPLTACSNFLLDRYHEDDHTLARFVSALRKAAPSLPADLTDLFKRCRMYLGNTLLCYRTGWDKKGQQNLSKYSFENCREHLGRHVDALSARVLVTFGREPARSIAHLVVGNSDAGEQALADLRRAPQVKKVMERYYAVDRQARGIACTRAGREIAFVPLCHPSMPNSYEGDYRALARLLVG